MLEQYDGQAVLAGKYGPDMPGGLGAEAVRPVSVITAGGWTHTSRSARRAGAQRLPGPRPPERELSPGAGRLVRRSAA
jgi:hypothetical protein